MTRISIGAIALWLLVLGSPARGGQVQTSLVSVLNGQTPQCSVVNHRTTPVSVETTVFCEGTAFLGPAVLELLPNDRDVVFGTNTGPNQLCWCTLSFKGSAGKIRGVLQVYDGNVVLERAEAR
jgi:hypothetical protein